VAGPSRPKRARDEDPSAQDRAIVEPEGPARKRRRPAKLLESDDCQESIKEASTAEVEGPATRQRRAAKARATKQDDGGEVTETGRSTASASVGEPSGAINQEPLSWVKLVDFDFGQGGEYHLRYPACHQSGHSN